MLFHAYFQFEISAIRVRVGTEAAVPLLEKNMLAVVSLVLLEKIAKVCDCGDEIAESGDEIVESGDEMLNLVMKFGWFI